MSLNPTGTTSYNWNYNNPERDGYSLELWGTVVALQEVQHRKYNPSSNQPGTPEFWPDGNPKMDIRVGFATPDGSLKSIQMQKAGKKQVSGEKPSLHMQLFNLTNGNMMELMGKTLHLKTWPANPTTGQAWGLGNPRLFSVEEVEGTTYQLAYPLPEEYKVPELYANDAVSGGQTVQPQAQAPQQIQTPTNIPPIQNGMYAAPTVPQQPVAPMAPQPMQQPMQQVPVQQVAPQPAMAPQAPVAQAPVAAPQPMAAAPAPAQAPQPAPVAPTGMDPAVAQAMQAVGATNVEEVPVDVYGDIPF